MEGDDRVIKAAQMIVQSLGTSKNMTEDMIMILSSFDNRLSTITDLLSKRRSGVSSSFNGGSELEDRLDAAEKLFNRSGSISWEDSPDESTEYLAAIDDIISITEELANCSAAEDLEALDRAESLLQIAMARLELEFGNVMENNVVRFQSSYLYSSSIGGISFVKEFESSTEVEEDVNDGDSVSSSMRRGSYASSSEEESALCLVRPEAMPQLKDIAKRMMRSKYEKECCQVYNRVQGDFLDECLLILGVDKMGIEKVQRIEWIELDWKMKKWCQAVKVVVRVLLPGEKQMCEQIFGSSDLGEVCFTETAKGCLMRLLSFAEAVAIGKRSPEKLFRILGMYDALSDVMPDLRDMFPEEFKEFIWGEAEGILKWLGDAAKGTLLELENAVQRDESRKPVQGGDIHPLMRYVMNYVKLLLAYSGTLNGLLDGGETEGGDRNNDNSCEGGDMSPLVHHVLLILSYLESSIEEKSKHYEDSALQYIFLMNNKLYMVQKVRDSELGEMLGNDWIRKHRGQIRQHSTSYLRASWTRVLSYLKPDGLGDNGSSSHVSKSALKERFKNFNMGIEEIQLNQRTWRVSDPQLREELRISISEMLLPAYRSFMGRFGSHLEGGRHSSKYIKYSVEDLEKSLSDLFEGSTGLQSHHRRKNSM